jgi:hypothetical protein
VPKVVRHPTEDSWQKTEVSKNNVLRIRLCAKNAGKGLFALISLGFEQLPGICIHKKSAPGYGRAFFVQKIKGFNQQEEQLPLQPPPPPPMLTVELTANPYGVMSTLMPPALLIRSCSTTKV